MGGKGSGRPRGCYTGVLAHPEHKRNLVMRVSEYEKNLITMLRKSAAKKRVIPQIHRLLVGLKEEIDRNGNAVDWSTLNSEFHVVNFLLHDIEMFIDYEYLRTKKGNN